MNGVEPAHKAATYEDLLAIPDGKKAEIMDRTLMMSPAPLPRHSKAQRTLSSLIGGPYDDDDGRGGPGGWWILIEVDVHIKNRHVLRPDISGWKRHRLPAPWDTRPIATIPDWVCEVISPSTAAIDRVRKREIYADAGVQHYWIVDPAARILETLELRDGQWVEIGTYDDSNSASIEPFPALTLEVGRLFPNE